jgi:YD repeat-containing protein
VPTGPTTLTLATIGYDGASLSTPSGSAPREWDSAYTSGVTARGNVTSSTDVSGNTTTLTYDIYGNTTATTVNGVTTTASTSSTTNFAAPDSITVNSMLTTSMTYSPALGLTSETGPSGTSVDLGYDLEGRPASSTSAFGAVTYYTYNDTATPPNVCTSVNTRWTQTFLDGLGRTSVVWTGSYTSAGPTTSSSASGAVTLSVAETNYESCGCSPLGKMYQQAIPHSPGANPVYKIYTYDGIGRTTEVTKGSTDTAGETDYSYAGNTVKVPCMLLRATWLRYSPRMPSAI